MALPHLTLDEAYRLFDGLCERRERALDRGQVAAVQRIDKELEELLYRLPELEAADPENTRAAKTQRMLEDLERVQSEQHETLDELTLDVAAHFMGRETAGLSEIQRQFSIGYTRSARIMDELEDLGVVGPFAGSVLRQVLIGPEVVASAGVTLSVPPPESGPRPPASAPDSLDRNVAGLPLVGWLLLLGTALFAWLVIVLQQ